MQQSSHSYPKRITIACGPRNQYQEPDMCLFTEIDFDGCMYYNWIQPNFIVNDGNGICTLQAPFGSWDPGFAMQLMTYNHTCQKLLSYNLYFSPLTGEHYFHYRNEVGGGETFADWDQPFLAAKV
jgi:hypothetical protein